MGQRIFIHDVVARDGFQIEPSWIPTERKIEIIDLLSSTGVAKIEATSFVSPKAVPNLRDAAEVMAGIRRNPAVTHVALLPNARGAERRLPANLDEIVLAVGYGVPDPGLTLHLQSTRGMGLADVRAVVAAGVVRGEGCLGGLGGCSFEPGATGNVGCEDVVHMLQCMGCGTGVDLYR